MDSTNLAHFIEENRIRAEIVRLEEATPTVEAAAAAMNVQPEQIGKSLLFLAGGEPVLVISNGTTKVGYRALADSLAINRRMLKLANADQVTRITGYPVGTVPPFGHASPLKTLIHVAVMEQATIYAGGGAIDALMRIETKELLRATSGTLVNL